MKFPSLCRYAIILAIGMALSSCKDMPNLNDMERHVEERPDSILAALQNIDPSGIKGRARKAQYALLLSQALDKNYVDIVDDSLIRIATDYYCSRGSRRHRALAFYYQGRVYQNAMAYPSASVSISHALAVADTSDHHLMGLLYRTLADISGYNFHGEDQLKYCLLAKRHFAQEQNDGFLQWATLDLADAYHDNGKFDEASREYSNTSVAAMENNDTTLYAESMLRYAHHLSTQNSEDSLALATSIFKDLYRSFKPRFSAANLASYSYCLIHYNEFEAARPIIEESWELTSSLQDSLRIQITEVNLLEKRGDIKGALDLYSAIAKRESSIYISNLGKASFSAERNMQREHAVSTRLRLQKMRLLIVNLVLCTVILTFGIWLTLKRKNRRLILQLSEKENELHKRLHDLEVLEQKMAGIDQNRLDVINMLRSMARLEAEYLSGIYEAYNTYHHTGSQMKKFIQSIEKMSIAMQDIHKYEALEVLIDTYGDGIMTSLRQHVGMPSESYYRIACYSFAGMSCSTIAFITGLQLQNIYTYRKRIRKHIAESNAPNKEAMAKLESIF